MIRANSRRWKKSREQMKVDGIMVNKLPENRVAEFKQRIDDLMNGKSLYGQKYILDAQKSPALQSSSSTED